MSRLFVFISPNTEESVSCSFKCSACVDPCIWMKTPSHFFSLSSSNFDIYSLHVVLPESSGSLEVFLKKEKKKSSDLLTKARVLAFT